MKKTDAEIQQEVLHELEWDTRVRETEVGVVVDRGVVTLSGAVGSWAKRRAAQEAAHRVAGVLDVANDIDVHLPGSGPRSDADMPAWSATAWNGMCSCPTHAFAPPCPRDRSRWRATSISATSAATRNEPSAISWASPASSIGSRSLHPKCPSPSCALRSRRRYDDKLSARRAA